MLKGKTTIELTDVRTGKKESYEDTNMITNALRDICAFFPQLWVSNTFNSQFLPLHEKGLGGVKLFSARLNEDPDNYYLPNIQTSRVVGYASNNTSAGTDPKRGSRNLVETKEVDNGYQLVWDFTTAEANGTISCVCLTTAQGGTNVWFPFRPSGLPEGLPIERSDYVQPAYVDYASGILITVDRSNMIIKKYKIPFDSIGVTDALFGKKLVAEAQFRTSNNFDRIFFDGGDGYLYSFFALAQGPGSTATVNIGKISIETLEYTETPLALSGLKVAASSTSNKNAIIYGGYLYMPKYGEGNSNYSNTYYRIKISDAANVTEIQFAEWSGKVETYRQNIMYVNNGMLAANGVLFDPDTGEHDVFFPDYGLNNKYYYEDSSNPRFLNGNYESQKGRVLMDMGYSSYCYTCIDPNVLMTINNLATPIEKTSDKTMKITYTLTYV